MISGPTRFTRRQALLGGLSLAVLAACGDDGGGSGPDGTGGEGDGDGATRTVDDVFGPVTIPAEPRRVLLLGDIVAADALHLGFPLERIAGVAWSERRLDHLDHLRRYGDIATLVDAGDWYEPNLELMATLDPDLIVNFGFDDEGSRDQRDVYAPLGPVFTVYNGYASLDETMRYLRDVGTALALEDAAAAAEAAFRAEVDDVVARLPEDLPTVATIRPFDDGTFYANSNPLLHALGLPGPHPSEEDMTVEYSVERLGDLEADRIIAYSTNAETPDEVRARMEAVPTFAALRAVQEGRVSYVEAVGWLNWDVPALELGLADIESTLFG